MKRFGLAVLAAAGMVLATGGTARAQSATQAYADCREDAFWTAYDCFIASTSYWGDCWCNTKWDFNNTACDVKLAKSVLPI